MIQVHCGGCNKRYNVPEAFAGKKMRCKQCSSVVSIPAALEGSPGSAAAESAPQVEAPPPAAAATAGKPGAPAPPRSTVKKLPTGLRKPPGIPAAKGSRPMGLPARKLGAKPLGRSKALRPAAVESEADTPAAAPASRKKLLFLVAVCLVLAGGLGFWGYTSWFGGPARKETGAVTATSSKPAKEKEPAAKESAGAPAAAAPQTAADSAEPPAPEVLPLVDPLAVVPKDVGFVAGIAFGRLVNIPAVRQAIEKGLTENADAQVIADAFTEAGFDPFAHLRTVWLAGSIYSLGGPPAGPTPQGGAAPPAAAQAPPSDPVLVVLEGSFEKEKLIKAFQKKSLLGAAPAKQGRFDVYEVKEDGKPAGLMAFLSEEQILIGEKTIVERALKLPEGGEAVRANSTLKAMSQDFGAANLAWVVLEPPRELLGMLAAGEKAAAAGKGPPVPKVLGGFLAVDPSEDGGGFAIEVQVHCPTEDDVRKTQMYVGPMLGGMKAQAPPPLQPLLAGLKLKPEGKTLGLSLVVTGEMLAQLQALGQPPEAAGAVPGGAAADEETSAAGGQEEAEAVGDEEPAEEAAPEAAGDAAEEKAPAKEKAPTPKPSKSGAAKDKKPKEKPGTKPAEEEPSEAEETSADSAPDKDG